jgi:hypothetical protein
MQFARLMSGGRLVMADMRRRLIDRLEKLGVEHRPLQGQNDGFSALCYGGKAFAHFHSDTELDIRLTRAVIEHEGLTDPAASAVHPNRTNRSHWIEVRFTTSAHLGLVIRLVKLAIDEI